MLSGSIALLADTIHNFGDAATAIPLSTAFLFARRPISRRFTFGYGRADVDILVPPEVTVAAGHCVAHEVEHQLHQQVEFLSEAIIQVEPAIGQALTR